MEIFHLAVYLIQHDDILREIDMFYRFLYYIIIWRND